MTAQRGLDHLLRVDRVVQRLAHPYVVERLVSGVEEQEQVVHSGPALDLQAAFLQLGDIGVRNVVGDLRARTRTGDLGDARRGVHDRQPVHLLERGFSRPVVIGEGLERRVGLRIVRGLPVRPRTDRLPRRRLVQRTRLGEDMLRHDLREREPLRPVGEREPEHQIHRLLVDLLHLLQPGREEALGERRRFGVQHTPVREDHVVGGDGLPVVPLRALPQREPPRGRLEIGRDLGREGRVRLTADRIGVQQPLVDVVVGGHRERRRREQRVPALVVAVADHRRERPVGALAPAARLVRGLRPRGAGGQRRADRGGRAQRAGVLQERPAVQRRCVGRVAHGSSSMQWGDTTSYVIGAA